MRIIQTPVYQYSELSAAAHENARQWWRETSAADTFFAEPVIEDAAECAAILGLEIDTRNGRPAVYWSGFSSQGDGASFVGRYRYAKGAARNIRKHAPKDAVLHAIADRLQRLQHKYFFGVTATITAGGSTYCHAYTMQACAEHDTRAVSAEDEKEFLECFRDFANWIYRGLESENEYVNSDEYVAETIEANEYEFTVSGRRA